LLLNRGSLISRIVCVVQYLKVIQILTVFAGVYVLLCSRHSLTVHLKSLKVLSSEN
jgi:hypothetical protein